MFSFLLFTLCSLPIIALIAFIYYLLERAKDKAIERHLRLYRFRPDANGNYEYYHDLSESAFAPTPGNAPFHPTIIHSNGVTREVTRVQRPVVFNNYRAGSRRPYLEAEEVTEISDPAPIEAETAPKLLSEAAVSAFILDSKRKGRGKMETARLLQIKPGSNAAYIDFTAKWNEVNL